MGAKATGEGPVPGQNKDPRHKKQDALQERQEQAGHAHDDEYAPEEDTRPSFASH
jgi:hypothetical protein